MAGAPPQLIAVDEARRRVAEAVRPLPREQVPLGRALGRTLAADAVAGADLPPFDASAMDGFAVGADEPGRFPVVGESRAGTPFGEPLPAGAAIRISTGAMVPRGTHAVVPVERTEVDGDHVTIPATAAGQNIRRAGEDLRAGERAIAAGTRLGAAEVAMLAALGAQTVVCGGRPRVGVLVTGDELVEPGSPLGPGQIHNSNAYALLAQTELAGAAVVGSERAGDDPAATRAALERLLDAADVVCVSGGVSVGEHDHVRRVLADLGAEERFWGVRLQPGKPTWFGTRGRTLAFGLPGNPVSVMVTFAIFVRPALRALQGGEPHLRRGTARLATPLRRNPRREQFVRVRLEARDDGWHAQPTKAQNSHILSSMLGADALARVPAGDGDVEAGERVDIEML